MNQQLVKILLVDDDLQSLESTQRILEFSGYKVVTASNGQMALEQLRPTHENPVANFDVVLTDVRMPKLDGLELLKALSVCQSKVPVILMTAYGRIQDAVWAMKLGAVDFLIKPFKKSELLTAIESALKFSKAMKSTHEYKKSELLLGNSSAIKSIKKQIEQVAPTLATVLITGESGTGKELVAKLIHRLSLRSGERFVALNCAALPEPLIESELFGYQKGAFTGAHASKEGLFEAAHGGTLFLDEIADMPLSLQAKLLRVLQEREVRRLGDNESRKVDVRIVAATHQDLGQNVKEGKFRLDLQYRLEVVTLSLAPLRERAEDIPLLADYFLKESCQRHGKVILEILPEVIQILLSYAWPGNVRELFNVIERAVVFCNQEKITKEFLPTHLLQISKEPLCLEKSQISIPLGLSLEEVEKILIQKTLEATSGDKNLTAKLLGVHSRTIYRKLGLVNK